MECTPSIPSDPRLLSRYTRSLWDAGWPSDEDVASKMRQSTCKDSEISSDWCFWYNRFVLEVVVFIVLVAACFNILYRVFAPWSVLLMNVCLCVGVLWHEVRRRTVDGEFSLKSIWGHSHVALSVNIWLDCSLGSLNVLWSTSEVMYRDWYPHCQGVLEGLYIDTSCRHSSLEGLAPMTKARYKAEGGLNQSGSRRTKGQTCETEWPHWCLRSTTRS